MPAERPPGDADELILMPTALQPVLQSDLFSRLPGIWRGDPLPAIRRALRAAQRTLIVLDDDPTGTQTVRDVPVLTEWSVESLEAELWAGPPVFYVLTNTRSLPAADAGRVVREIADNLATAGARTGRDFSVVSRSDSTLRGHFPLEMDVLAASTWARAAPWIVVPFFEAGRRFTIADVHYVGEAEWLVPAHLTPFARDAVFGYRSSNLREWVQEKTGGRVAAGAVASISIDEIRIDGPAGIYRRLAALPAGAVCIVNAADQRDLDVFVLGLLQAEAEGRRFLYRTAASFVAARAGFSRKPLIRAGKLPLGAAFGGLVIVGSHVPKTTEQLGMLLAGGEVSSVEIDVERLLSPETRAEEIAHACKAAGIHLGKGRDMVVHTSRRLIIGESDAGSLRIGRSVSEALVAIVSAIAVRPRYLVAKGGITASDIATHALGVKRAQVAGQILSGVPVWSLGAESRWPGLAYVVFPGNVGGPRALLELIRSLARPSPNTRFSPMSGRKKARVAP